MTQDEIIEMAQEIAAQYSKAERFQTWTHDYMMQRLMELVEAERERIKQANAPEIERVNAHIKELERDAARYREVREWDFCGYDHGLISPESVDRAVDNARGQA